MAWALLAFTVFIFFAKLNIFIAAIAVGSIGILYCIFEKLKKNNVKILDSNDFSTLKEDSEPVYISGTVHGKKNLKTIYDNSDCVLSMKKFQPINFKYGLSIHLYNDNTNLFFKPDGSDELVEVILKGDIDGERLFYGAYNADSEEAKKYELEPLKDVHQYIISEDVLREGDRVIILGTPLFYENKQISVIEAEKVILDTPSKRAQIKNLKTTKINLIGCLSAVIIFGSIFLKLILE